MSKIEILRILDMLIFRISHVLSKSFARVSLLSTWCLRHCTVFCDHDKRNTQPPMCLELSPETISNDVAYY